MKTKKTTEAIKAAARPWAKWSGGKTQLLNVLTAAVPKKFNRYHEPFIGGGALFFKMAPHNAVIADSNSELINSYQVIRDDVHALIEDLQQHKNEADYFYEVRAKDLTTLTPVERASRFIYLNKTCFNGLYRENKLGRFNTSFGRYKNPKIIDKDNLLAVQSLLNQPNIEILHSDYLLTEDRVAADDFVYLDAPYVPLSKTANFTSYVKDGFTLEDQTKLAQLVDRLTERNVKVMVSNSNTDIIHELYQAYNIKKISATRAINSKADKRGKAQNEVLITNY